MISTLSDNSNKLLLELFSEIGIHAHKATIMSDTDAIAIFNKLAFQCRNCTGVFSEWGYQNRWQGSIQQIENELAEQELFR